jgi:hypothetical protein
MQLTMADVSTNMDDKGRPRRKMPLLALTLHNRSHELSPGSDNINLSSVSRILLCAAHKDILT